MQASGGIADNHISAPALAGVDGVKHHRSRVAALLVADQLGTGTVCPDCQLFRCRRTEGIRCCQQHLLALTPEISRHLADGGGLAHAVDADHQHHRGLGGEIQRALLPHQAGDDLPQLSDDLRGLGDAGMAYPVPELVHDAHGHIGAHIAHDECFFQLVKEVLVHLGKTGSQILQTAHQRIPGLFQPGADLFKKSHSILLTGLVRHSGPHRSRVFPPVRPPAVR